MSEKIIVSLENVNKSFNDLEVLKNVSFILHNAENLVILGKSGCGKSVLIKTIVGLVMPDSGKISLLGQDISTLNNENLNKLRKKVGFLFQSAALYDSMSVHDNLAFQLRDAVNQSDEEKNTLIAEALKNVGLLDAKDKMPSELSGGMKKRVGLARALILKPEIILYDEPTTGLDTITAKEISNLILEVQQKYKSASIIITHDINCARITSNRILVMKEGNFTAEGTFKELENSKDEFVKSFF